MRVLILALILVLGLGTTEAQAEWFLIRSTSIGGTKIIELDLKSVLPNNEVTRVAIPESDWICFIPGSPDRKAVECDRGTSDEAILFVAEPKNGVTGLAFVYLVEEVPTVTNLHLVYRAPKAHRKEKTK